ncbi:MAG TPA: hypothetical protein IAC31_02170 [Candidatus Faecousia intestinigallinarum]|nr:hypothetical protein [Candidatus Faecousia intestinigallinarum]
MTLFFFLLAACLAPQTAYAVDDPNLLALGNDAYRVYLIICACVIPFLILRYAIFGFRLLGISAMARGEFSLDRLKKDVLETSVAAAVLIILPYIVGAAIQLFQTNAWAPPDALAPPAPEACVPWLGGYNG